VAPRRREQGDGDRGDDLERGQLHPCDLQERAPRLEGKKEYE
jgi:hypothetical protein